jgi:hypothetical protein
MKKMLACWAGLALLMALVTGVSAAPELGKVRITGWALDFSVEGRGANQAIQIDVNQWSPAAVRDRLFNAFTESKQRGLLAELKEQPEIGRWRFPGFMGRDPDQIYRLGTPIRYAMNHPLDDGGRRIVVMTDRLMGFREIVNRPRTIDYPFTLMEMRFDGAGKGEGRMAWFSQIRLDKSSGMIEIENYTSEPVRLNELRLEPRN